LLLLYICLIGVAVAIVLIVLGVIPAQALTP
jgi:hypothetical protein